MVSYTIDRSTCESCMAGYNIGLYIVVVISVSCFVRKIRMCLLYVLARRPLLL